MEPLNIFNCRRRGIVAKMIIAGVQLIFFQMAVQEQYDGIRHEVKCSILGNLRSRPSNRDVTFVLQSSARTCPEKLRQISDYWRKDGEQ